MFFSTLNKSAPQILASSKRLLVSRRWNSGKVIPKMSAAEDKIYRILDSTFKPNHLEVTDMSSGEGAMFAISIESSMFNGLSMVKQHRMVNKALKDEIAKWHGLRLKTKQVSE